MRSRLTACLAMVLLPLMAASVHAQELPRVCNPKKEDCGCERNWGCWDLLYTTKGTILGVIATGSHVEGDASDTFDAGVVTSYATEHFGTKEGLAAHVLLHAAIGGGTASTEGSLLAAGDVGLRLSVSPTSGPFLRVGPSGMWLGHERLSLAFFEPLTSRIGYQVLDGDELIEAGITTGMSIAGHFAAAGARRGLGYSVQLGGYVAARFTDLRFEASLLQLETSSAVPGAGVWLGRGAICSYVRPAAICVELLDVRGEGVTASGAARPMRALYSGLTIGLTP